VSVSSKSGYKLFLPDFFPSSRVSIGVRPQHIFQVLTPADFGNQITGGHINLYLLESYPGTTGMLSILCNDATPLPFLFLNICEKKVIFLALILSKC